LRNAGELADLRPIVERLRARFVRINGADRHAQNDAHDDGKRRIREGGRNAFLAREAGRLRRLGLSGEAINAALQEINVERCDPPLGQAEVETIARSIGRYEAPDSGKPMWSLPEPISGEELRGARLAPDCIVESYLYADVAVLVAPGGTGKTTLELYEAVHIALGLPLYGLTVHKPGRVLILTAEDSRELLVARMRAIVDAMELSPAQIDQVLDRVRISDLTGDPLKLTVIVGDVVVPSPALDDLIVAARELEPVLVIVDPAISFGVGEARVNDAEQGLIEAARRIRRSLNCCVRYVHHSGKQNARDKAVDQYAGRGGSALPDGARMVAVLQPLTTEEWNKATGSALVEGETGMLLARPKTSYAPPADDILIYRAGYHFAHMTRATRTATEELSANCEQIVRVIETECAAGRRPTKHTLEIMAASLGRTRQEIRDAIIVLLTNGRIALTEIDPAPARGIRTYLRVASPNPNGEAK
jgi:RecA-family ATPase